MTTFLRPTVEPAAEPQTEPLVVAFADGDRSMADLLGGKGANLAEMTRLGLPVPPGFVITTTACRAYLTEGHEPDRLAGEVASALAALEKAAGRRFGDPSDPLLVSVRSGARFSMPGMMDTVLNVGLTDATLPGLAARGGERFAWDCYRRLVEMYGRTVCGVDPGLFAQRLAQARRDSGVGSDPELSAEALQAVTADYRAILRRETGHDLPQDPAEQLHTAITAVFVSWNGERARVYRAHEGIPDTLGTAVNVVEMVYGNTGIHSGSGVCFTRNPATGEPDAYGDYLQNAQGEDVVNGSRTTVSLDQLGVLEPNVHAELLEHLDTLEAHYGDLCDVEFTVEDGHLWILQTRIGKRSAAAAFRIACDLADKGVIDLDEALRRVDGHQLQSLLHPQFAATADRTVIAAGLPASPGAAVGRAVFDSARAADWAAQGHSVVLVRHETSPDDLPGMLAAVAVVTARGGLTSHAAVVARGLGRTCVTGVEDLDIDLGARKATTRGGVVIEEGDLVSVDGTSGEIMQGGLPVSPSTVSAAIEAELGLAEGGRASDASDFDDPVVQAVLTLLAHADARRLLGVRANAETAADAHAARLRGAEGIGLCRTEHMLLGERRHLVEAVVTDHGRMEALAEIERLSREDFTKVLREMDGFPVVVRLLDPPLHEFLPDLIALSVEAAVAEAQGRTDEELDRRLGAARRWHEANPMLGLRGVRLLTVVPDLVETHVRALVNATLDLREQGHDPRPELMVPLVAEPAEFEAAADRIRDAIALTARDRRTTVSIPVGVMIELPRAALLAASLAEGAEFFSFGTNDLTQTTWGISRDDAETSFLAQYRTEGLLSFDPFSTLDLVGVGRLVQMAAEAGRTARPELGLGACGEHAGDPESIRFFSGVGLDYVSCSPMRVPVARLEAGRAAVLDEAGTSASDTR
ncbi:MAG TPA: pyruvate, phosphate dikinase [Dermatophilaceae bacterium]|nr:pyruvate, phosphate dikinase [Dermatophilaceae bacterium]